MSPFVFDKSLVLERLGGDEGILVMMLDMFLQDVDANCAALTAAQAAGDPALLQREAHTVKALLATVSDDAGAEMAQSLEKQARLGDLAGSEQATADLVQRIQAVSLVLRGELAG